MVVELYERLVMKTVLIIAFASVALLLAGCDPGARQARGFRLPEGEAAAGQKAFVELNCHTCHTVKGVELPKPESAGQYQVPLGGEVFKVRSYGELVTAIIHPAHDISRPYVAHPPAGLLTDEKGPTTPSKSPMPSFNHVVTAQQLVDLTTFLHGRYVLRPAEDYTSYF